MELQYLFSAPGRVEMRVVEWLETLYMMQKAVGSNRRSASRWLENSAVSGYPFQTRVG